METRYGIQQLLQLTTLEIMWSLVSLATDAYKLGMLINRQTHLSYPNGLNDNVRKVDNISKEG